jgi:uncharacterized DUF497 family protein
VATVPRALPTVCQHAQHGDDARGDLPPPARLPSLLRIGTLMARHPSCVPPLVDRITHHEKPLYRLGASLDRFFCGYKNLSLVFFGDTIIFMKITFDPAKRSQTFDTRGLAFEDAALVFEGQTLDMIDDRSDYGEERIITVGHLVGRMVIVVWTQRGDARHVISMRKANEREEKRFAQRLGEG